MDLKDINLMNDALFKAFMCHENNRNLVIDFIHGVTGIEKEILRKGTFIGGEEIAKRRVTTKKQMMDFSVRLGNKQRIIIEMNQSSGENLFNKNDLYAFSVIVELSHKNMVNYPKVILINIDNFNKYETDKPVLTFKIRDEEGNIETEMYESIHLVLANISNPKYNIDKEIKKFASFLKERDLEKLAENFRGDEKYMAAIRTVEDLTTDEDLIGSYDLEEARERDIFELKLEKEFARKEGIQEGIQQGLEQGIIEGANQNAIETAKKLLAMHVLSVEQIASATNLMLEEIIKLKQENF